jgi:hypothetical protein
MENTNNKILIDDETENYWQTQALLVMKNLDINEKNKNIFPVKYSLKGKTTNNNIVNNIEIMEDISI